jgi:hypothetical protein
MLMVLSASLPACDDGCAMCTGVTADKVVCKDDYQVDGDYETYIREYEELGGVCEE